MQEGLAAATEAIEVDPTDSMGYARKGHLLGIARDRDRIPEALTFLRSAHELNPNDVRVLSPLGFVLTLAGNPEEAVEFLLQALRISPRDPMRYGIRNNLAFAYMVAKEYAKAIEHTLLVESEFPNSVWPQMFSAVSHVGLGDIDRAKAALERARRIAPEFVQSRLDGVANFQKPEHQQRYVTFLRIAASLEDPSAADALR